MMSKATMIVIKIGLLFHSSLQMFFSVLFIIEPIRNLKIFR